MDNISDLLANRGIKEPEEIKIIKKYILDEFGEDVLVKVETSKITIFVSNAALANAIRMQISKIQEVCHTDKRIAIYIGKD
jgi:hypothetical protein